MVLFWDVPSFNYLLGRRILKSLLFLLLICMPIWQLILFFLQRDRYFPDYLAPIYVPFIRRTNLARDPCRGIPQLLQMLQYYSACVTNVTKIADTNTYI